MCETKLKGSGTFEWDRVNGMKAALQEYTDGYARGVAIIMEDECCEKVFDCKSASVQD